MFFLEVLVFFFFIVGSFIFGENINNILVVWSQLKVWGGEGYCQFGDSLRRVCGLSPYYYFNWYSKILFH
jgi:hypothetical protein